MSAGDVNDREPVPFPNPQSPVPPGPAFQPQPTPPSPVQQVVNGVSQQVGPQPPPQTESLQAAPVQLRSSAEAMALFQRLGTIAPAPSFAGYAELSSLVKQAKSMPYDRLMTGAEMVVELAQMMVVDCTSAGHPIDFPTALRAIHKISGVLSEDPVVFAQIATLFQ